MAHRCNRFAGLVEGTDQIQDFFVQTQVFRSPTARDHQRVVIGLTGTGEIEIQREQVTGFFAVGLVTFEVMDRGAHGLARSLVRADRMDGVPDHLQGLERHHHFVVFDVIADQHQDFFRGHGEDSSGQCLGVLRVDLIRRLR